MPGSFQYLSTQLSSRAVNFLSNLNQIRLKSTAGARSSSVVSHRSTSLRNQHQLLRLRNVHIQGGQNLKISKRMSVFEGYPSGNAAHLAMEDKFAPGGGGRGIKRGGGRSGGRGGRGGGSGGGGLSREVFVSKAMSKLLRHKAGEVGITLDGEGFAPLDKVLAYGPIKSLNVTFDDIQSAVANNEKQRFSMKPNPETNPSLSTDTVDPSHYLIRANQGHSIKLDSASLMEPITLEAGNVPPKVLHGTYFAFWPAIVESGGLKPMGRNHVHCSVGMPEEGVVSGMRRDAELVIEVDVERSLQEGIQWWKSDNGVVLTEGGGDGILSTRFFKLVTGRKIDVGVLWEGGEKRASLPAGIKARVPQGKGPRGGGGRSGRGNRGGS